MGSKPYATLDSMSPRQAVMAELHGLNAYLANRSNNAVDWARKMGSPEVHDYAMALRYQVAAQILDDVIVAIDERLLLLLKHGTDELLRTTEIGDGD
jgi:hypothetical protein